MEKGREQKKRRMISREEKRWTEMGTERVNMKREEEKEKTMKETWEKPKKKENQQNLF